VLSTLSQDVPTYIKACIGYNDVINPSSIEELTLASIQKLEATYTKKIQKLKDMHGQEVEVLQKLNI
jgi:hypothetical protein